MAQASLSQTNCSFWHNTLYILCTCVHVSMWTCVLHPLCTVCINMRPHIAYIHIIAQVQLVQTKHGKSSCESDPNNYTAPSKTLDLWKVHVYKRTSSHIRYVVYGTNNYESDQKEASSCLCASEFKVKIMSKKNSVWRVSFLSFLVCFAIFVGLWNKVTEQASSAACRLLYVLPVTF